MATTDANGMVFYETSDNVTPLQNVLNGISTAVTNAFDSTDRVFFVADETARDNLLAARGAPLTVSREDTGQWERNAGSGWVVIAPMMQKGNVLPTGVVAAGGIGALTPVVFPVPFPSAPEVILQDRGARLNFFNVTVTTTGFSAATLNVSSEASNAASLVRWIALL